MKKNILLIAFCLISTLLYAQKIKKNEIDKFTKSEIIETSSETLYSVNSMGTGWCYMFDFCIRRVNGEYSMPTNILMRDIVKYTENDGVIFLLDNDDTVVLKTNYTGIGAESFGKGYWFNTNFSLSKEDVEKLKNHKILSVRINYMDGKYDRDLKGKKKEMVMKCLKLFDNL